MIDIQKLEAATPGVVDVAIVVPINLVSNVVDALDQHGLTVDQVYEDGEKDEYWGYCFKAKQKD